MNFEEAQKLMMTTKGKTRDSRGRRLGKLIGKNTRLYYRVFEYKQTPHYDIQYRGKLIIMIFTDRMCFCPSSDEGCEILNDYLPVGMHVCKEGSDEYGYTKWYLRDSNVTNPDNPDEDVMFRLNTIRHISNDGKVMLYSTEPKYHRVYEEEEE